jgi:two-component SAPR family response regulator
MLCDRQIMIVEDEAMIGFALKMELEDAGATPIGPVTTLSGALEMLDVNVIDGAILDIDLNGVDVYPLADHLIDRGVSFVFHTAHGKRQELRDVYPGVPVCIKPSNTDEVLEALGKVFQDRSRN